MTGTGAKLMAANGLLRYPIEGEMNDACFRRFRAHSVVPLQPAQLIPEANATTEQDRRNRDMQTIDQPRFEEIAHDTCAAANSNVFPVGNGRCPLESIHRSGADEVKCRASSHFDRPSWRVGQNENRTAERRLFAPPTPPVRIIGETVQSEHARPHDLRTDILEIGLGVFVIDASGALAARVPKYPLLHCLRRQIGFDEAPPILTKRRLWCLIGRRCETVEGDDQVDTNCHGNSPERYLGKYLHNGIRY